MSPYWKETVVVVPRGLSEPLSVAEKLATLVAALVVTAGVGVGDEFDTITEPVIPQHDQCGVQ